MSILGQELKSKLSTGGTTQNNLNFLQTSKQHNEYPINGTPGLLDKPTPSQLDPKTPKKQYISNLPL